ncbi:MAG TPA: aspartate/glutamate racemase family protein [Pyrinomonadaceae bacterium]|nr:aspartate/glutamate racemase family protein [Pyrinomonadaceae bacterium]
MKPALGVLGGMGPLASADFLSSIYDYNLDVVEQSSPIVYLYSDPTFPDRTEIFCSGRDEELLTLVQNALHKLCELDVTKIVIACVTLHHLLPRLSPELRDKIISLPEIVLSRVIESKRRHLLIASSGTRFTRIFESQPQWSIAAPYLTWPDENDQHLVHEHIYREMKANGNLSAFVAVLEDLCRKYEVDSIVVGCTDVHRVSRYLSSGGRHHALSFIDPLQIIAQNYEEFLNEQAEHSRDVVSQHR